MTGLSHRFHGQRTQSLRETPQISLSTSKHAQRWAPTMMMVVVMAPPAAAVAADDDVGDDVGAARMPCKQDRRTYMQYIGRSDCMLPILSSVERRVWASFINAAAAAVDAAEDKCTAKIQPSCADRGDTTLVFSSSSQLRHCDRDSEFHQQLAIGIIPRRHTLHHERMTILLDETGIISPIDKHLRKPAHTSTRRTFAVTQDRVRVQ